MMKSIRLAVFIYFIFSITNEQASSFTLGTSLEAHRIFSLSASPFGLDPTDIQDSKSEMNTEDVLRNDASSMRKVYRGNPSLPGWKKGEFERLTNWAMSDEANRPIICEYEPSASWLWKKWDGTVLPMIWSQILFAMLLATGLDVAVHHFATSSWSIFSVPPVDEPLIRELQGINKLWEYQLTLSTFILSFFTQETYRHWKSVYFCTRAIQGRINDICLLITVGASRGTYTEYGCDSNVEVNRNIENGVTSGYSPEAATLVNLCSR
jgi:hypothetical protein